MRQRRFFLKVAATLLILLSVARGGGAVALLAGAGRDVAPAADRGTVLVAASGLAVVALLAGVAAVGLFLRRTRFWWLGIAATAAFVAGGIANGYLLFGAPRAAGLLGNVLAAALIVAALVRGRPALTDATSPTGRGAERA
jgi:hypothetical protein